MELEVVVKIVVNEFLSYKISLFKNIFKKIKLDLNLATNAGNLNT
jgi:hypothetical protein